jgi:hypothetical protein
MRLGYSSDISEYPLLFHSFLRYYFFAMCCFWLGSCSDGYFLVVLVFQQRVISQFVFISDVWRVPCAITSNKAKNQ